MLNCRIIPLARSISASILIMGKPHPDFCSLGWGHIFCSAGSSGVLTVVPSIISTRRPSQMEADWLHASHDNCSTSLATPAAGSRCRASQ